MTWPYGGDSKFQQKAVFELKIQYGSRESTIKSGLAQTKEYLERVDHHEGHLLIFDRDPTRSWDEKVYQEIHNGQGRTITFWGI